MSDIRVESEHDPSETGSTFVLRHDDLEACFRLPNTLDLTAAAEAGDSQRARQRLLERCLVSAQNSDGETVSVLALPETFLAKLAARMGEVQPQADVQLALACPQCHHRWIAPFDIAGFLWIELQAFAHRLLRENHELASAYGWREADIMDLTIARRQAYLDLIHQ